MRSILLALVLIPTAAHAGDPDVAVTPIVAEPPVAEPCQSPRNEFAQQRGAPPSMQRLDREPPADLYLGVMHTVGQCERPIMIGRFVESRR